MKRFKKFAQLLLTPLPSAMKIPLYRFLGAKIGPRAKIGIGTVLIAQEIELGPGARIKPLSLIAGLRKLSLGAHAQISSFCIVHGPASLVVKARGGIGVGCMVDLHADITFGEYSGPGPRCNLMTHGNSLPAAWGATTALAPITFGDVVWIGFGSNILPGVTIADRTVVLPNSTVGRSIHKSGVVADSLSKRSVLPLSVIPPSTSRTWLQHHIQELARAYYENVLREEGYILRINGSHYQMQSGKRVIHIHFQQPSATTEVSKNHSHWVIGFDLSTEFLEQSRGIEAIDVRHLLHTPAPSKAFRRALVFLSTNYGVRFADVRDRHYFTIQPPPLIEDEQAEVAA